MGAARVSRELWGGTLEQQPRHAAHAGTQVRALHRHVAWKDQVRRAVLGPVLLHVRSSRLRWSATLVPPRGCTLLPRHHLLLPLLPLLSRATQQAGGQLADGGVLVYSRSHLCLLHRLCGHACQLQRQSRRRLAVLDGREYCRRGVRSAERHFLRSGRLPHLRRVEGKSHRGPCSPACIGCDEVKERKDHLPDVSRFNKSERPIHETTPPVTSQQINRTNPAKKNLPTPQTNSGRNLCTKSRLLCPLAKISVHAVGQPNDCTSDWMSDPSLLRR